MNKHIQQVAGKTFGGHFVKSCFAGFAVLFLSIAVSGCGDSRTVITPAPATERIVEKKVEMKEKDNGTIEVKEKTTKEIVK